MNLSQCNRAQGTIKQRAFVRFLFDINNPLTFGNGTQAARKARYKGSDGVLANVAWENVRKPQVIEMAEDIVQNILSTDEVEREITKVAQTSTPIDGTMKMKALDLLTKIKAMQVQKIESSSTVTTIDPASIQRSIDRICAKTHQPKSIIAQEFLEEWSKTDDPDYDAALHQAIQEIVNSLPVEQIAEQISESSLEQ